jgi:hypothetical protein
LNRIVFLTGQGNAALHSTLTLEKNNSESIILHELMCGPLSQYEAGISNYDDFIWKHQVKTPDLSYHYQLVSGNGQSDPNVMNIHFENNILAYTVYSTRFDMEGDEIPPVILSGSIQF